MTGRKPSGGRAGFDLDESPIGRLASRKGKDGRSFLSEAEAMAAERLRADFTRAGLSPSITQRWDGTPRSDGPRIGAGDLSDAAIDAKGRVNAAVTAIGPELSGVVIDVCCFLKGLELVERERQWPVRSAKLMLKAGLAVLARHYGLAAIAAAGVPGRIRRWGAEGYKPAAAARRGSST